MPERSKNGSSLRLVDLIIRHSLGDESSIRFDNWRRARIHDVRKEFEVGERLKSTVFPMNRAETEGATPSVGTQGRGLKTIETNVYSLTISHCVRG